MIMMTVSDFDVFKLVFNIFIFLFIDEEDVGDVRIIKTSNTHSDSDLLLREERVHTCPVWF